MAKLRLDQVAELRFLHSQCRVALEFLGTTGQLPDTVVAEGLRGIDEGLELQNLRGMRMAHRDMQILARELQPVGMRQLDDAVRNASGRGLFTPEENANVITGIVNRGRIRNEREYFLIRSRFDEIEGQEQHVVEAQQLQVLLDAFGV